MTIKVNAMFDACPIPVVKTQKAMQELGGAGRAARPKPKSSAKTSTA